MTSCLTSASILEDAVNIEAGARVDRLGGFLGHDAGGGQRFGGGDFHRQPGAEAIFIAPDAKPFQAGL